MVLSRVASLVAAYVLAAGAHSAPVAPMKNAIGGGATEVVAKVLWNTPIPYAGTYVGMHSHRWPAGSPLSPAPKFKASIVRSHDYAGSPATCGASGNSSCNTAWRNIQHTSASTYDWTYVDNWYSAHVVTGAKIYWQMYGTPTYIASLPTTPDLYGNLGGASPPTDQARLAEFVSALVTRYPAIEWISIWNEPNFDTVSPYTGFFHGSHSDLAEMAKTIHTAAKAVRTSVRIVYSGIELPFTTFLTTPVPSDVGGSNKLAKDYIDDLGMHPYSACHGDAACTTYRLLDSFNLLKEYITAANMPANTPVHVDEMGYFTGEIHSMAGAAAAKSLARLLLDGLGMGLRSMILYSYDYDDTAFRFLGQKNPMNNIESQQMLQKMHDCLTGATSIEGVDKLNGDRLRLRTDKRTCIF